MRGIRVHIAGQETSEAAWSADPSTLFLNVSNIPPLVDSQLFGQSSVLHPVAPIITPLGLVLSTQVNLQSSLIHV